MFGNLKNSVKIKREQQRLRTRGSRRGAAMTIFAIALVFIFGCASLAVDYGLLVNDKNKWQRGVDAASLAGAITLQQDSGNTTKARSVAVQVAAENGVAVTDDKVTFLDSDTKIRVESANTRQLYFARVIGIRTGTVNAYAIAAVSTLGGDDLVPIGVTSETYAKYAPGGVPKTGTSNQAVITFIDHKKEAFGTDNFVLFDFRSATSNAKSPTHSLRQLKGDEPVKIGIKSISADDFDYLDALNAGSSETKFSEGISYRFQLAAGAPWYDAPTSLPADYLDYVGQHYSQVLADTEPETGAAPFKKNPRIMDLVVTDAITDPKGTKGGNSNSPVLDYAPVYVEKAEIIDGKGSDKTLKLTIRYLSRSLTAGGSSGVSLIQ